MINLDKKYPHLFQETTWNLGLTQAKFMLLEKSPPIHKISNINIIPRTRNKWITICLNDGTWEIPGGTLEPNEDYLSAAYRELLEEAGARLDSFRLIGAWHCISSAEKPYCPHLPFPEYYRIVGIGEVEIIKTPENPEGAEEIVAVEVNSIKNSIQHFLSSNRQDLAELYKLAFDIDKLNYEFGHFVQQNGHSIKRG